MDIVVSDVPEVGVDGGELEGMEVLREVTIHLVGGGFLADRDAVVCRHLGGLLNVGLK